MGQGPARLLFELQSPLRVHGVQPRLTRQFCYAALRPQLELPKPAQEEEEEEEGEDISMTSISIFMLHSVTVCDLVTNVFFHRSIAEHGGFSG